MPKFVRNPEIENEVLLAIAGTDVPVGVDYIAKKIHRNWGTTRAILLSLVIRKRIDGNETSHGWIFFPRKEKMERVSVTGFGASK